ncbi:class I SAM-dependent methyltransferase [Mollicutes bacterium LVI A0078]|nr:class I SAM-dependent methyltransferase [Mollicutes bacterium LVI A0075]WOO91371.1 class I SAM-dependent methyltransferase [Mollicutes bacterium LVI A0078]
MANIEQFNTIANKYESEQRMALYKLFNEQLQAINTGGKFLDFGCGTGNLGISLSSKFESVYLLDPSTEMRAICEQKILELGLDNCLVCSQNLEVGEELECTFDTIVIAQVLLHIPDYKLLLSKLVKYLNSNGQLIIFDYVRNEHVQSDIVHNGFVLEELIEYLQSKGLKYNFDKLIYSDENFLLGSQGDLFMLSMNKD